MGDGHECSHAAGHKYRACLPHHGFLELDNNTAELAVRPVTLGRKNYLFM